MLNNTTTKSGKKSNQKSSKKMPLCNTQDLITLLDEMETGIAVLNQDHICFMNNVFAQSLGYSKDEITGKSIDSFVGSDAIIKLRKYAENKQVSNEHLVTDIEVIKKDSSRKIIDISCKRIDFNNIPALLLSLKDTPPEADIITEWHSDGKFFQTVLENSPDVVAIVNADGTIRYETPSVQEILGYTSEEIMGKASMEFIHPDSITQVTEIFDQLMQNPDLPVRAEVQVQHKDGSWHDVQINGRNMINNPLVKGILANFRDITVHKKSDDALIKSEERFRALIENASDAIAIINLEGIITYISPNAIRISGFEKYDLENKHLSDLIHPEDIPILLSAFNDIITHPDKSITLELRIIHSDGTWHWIEGVGKNLLENTDVNGIICNCRDITERKNTEAILKQTERLYRLLAENVTDVIWVLNMDMQFSYFSPSIEHMRGYTPEEAISLPLEKTLTPGSLNHAVTTLSEELELEQSNQADPHRSRTIELEHFCKDGSRIWIENTMTFIRDENGKAVGILGISRDITERIRVEDSRREAEKRYRAMFDNRIQMVYIHDELGRFLDANDYALEVMGLKKEDINNRSFVDFVHPDDLQKAFEIVLDIMAKGYMEHPVELRIIRPTGEIMWTDTYCIPLEVSQDHYIGVGIVQDITERKNTEIALQQSEERYRVFTEKLTDAIWTMDMNLCYTYYSPAVTHMRGYTIEEIMSLSLSESMTPASVEVALKVLSEELAEEQNEFKDLNRSRTMELEVYCKDRPNIWAEVCVTFLRDENGNATGILGITRDITERKMIEKTIKQRTQQILSLQEITTYMQSTLALNEVLQRIAESVVTHMHFHIAMIFLADESKNTHRATVFYPNDRTSIEKVRNKFKSVNFVNLSVEDIENSLGMPFTQIEVLCIKGYSRVMDNCIEGKDTILHSLFELAGPWFPKETCEKVQELLVAKTIVDIPFYAKNKLMGSIIAFTSKDDITEEDMEPLRILAAHAGIAIENAKLNENLEKRVIERTNQLQAVNKELESFAYSVSHDLRSPLRSIDGFSQAILDDYADKLDKEGKDYLQRIRAAAQRMAQLIEAILQLSRLTRGEFNRKNVNLSALITSISEDLRQQNTERNVEFIIQPDLIVQGDERLLRAAMENLMNNAWKFTSKKDSARIEFGYRNNGIKPAFFIRDNGAGFDMNYSEKLFGAFQRLHTKNEFEGTGIGLATVQRIISRHDGQIWAEGAVNQGCTFYFTL